MSKSLLFYDTIYPVVCKTSVAKAMMKSESRSSTRAISWFARRQGTRRKKSYLDATRFVETLSTKDKTTLSFPKHLTLTERTLRCSLLNIRFRGAVRSSGRSTVTLDAGGFSCAVSGVGLFPSSAREKKTCVNQGTPAVSSCDFEQLTPTNQKAHIKKLQPCSLLCSSSQKKRLKQSIKTLYVLRLQVWYHFTTQYQFISSRFMEQKEGKINLSLH